MQVWISNVTIDLLTVTSGSPLMICGTSNATMNAISLTAGVDC